MLKRFPNLRDVDLRYTRVTSGGVAALKAALPRCRVAFLDAGSTDSVNVSQALPAGSPEAIAAGCANAADRQRSCRAGLRKSLWPRCRYPTRRYAPSSPCRDLKSWTCRPPKRETPASLVCRLPVRSRVEAGRDHGFGRGPGASGEMPISCALSASYSLVRGEGLANLAGLAALRDLDLSGSAVDNEGLRRITALKNLETVVAAIYRYQ